MMLEIVGARLIAPYFGASTYVWTAMIGVILGALSLGFWVGGRMADRDNPGKSLSLIIAVAAAAVLVMVLVQRPVLELIARQNLDLRLSAMLAATTLFGVPSLLIGIVSPHLAKIRITSLKTTGASIGRLEAAGALGSIAGTFLSGYFLLAFLGSRNLSIWLAITLVLTSLLAGWRRFLTLKLAVIVMAFLILSIQSLPAGVLSDTDSAYSRYLVKEALLDGRPARYLITDKNSIQSASFVNAPTEPALSYVKGFDKAAASFDNPNKIMVIGGGSHTFPNILQSKLPTAFIDVVEIDPALDDLAQKYFGFTPSQRTKLFYEDGRSFINRNNNDYDLIFVDAYTNLTPPFHLTSKEAVIRLRVNLSEGGVVISNAPTQFKNGYLTSLNRTYASVFNYVKVFRTTNLHLSLKQNFLVVASNNEAALARTAQNLGQSLAMPDQGVLLTDDYAPVERLSF